MRTKALLLLRVSLGLLLVAWGADKLRDASHGLEVAGTFYGGVVSSPAVMTAFGALEAALGASVVLGAFRRVTYPALLAITGTTLAAVWKSVIDPLGVVFEDAQLLFYPSLIIFAGALVLWAFRDDDVLAIDRRGRAA